MLDAAAAPLRRAGRAAASLKTGEATAASALTVRVDVTIPTMVCLTNSRRSTFEMSASPPAIGPSPTPSLGAGGREWRERPASIVSGEPACEERTRDHAGREGGSMGNGRRARQHMTKRSEPPPRDDNEATRTGALVPSTSAHLTRPHPQKGSRRHLNL